MTVLQRQWRKRALLQLVILFGTMAVVGWGMWWSEFRLANLAQAGPDFAEFFTRLVPPDWSVTGVVFRSAFETLIMAFVGTAIAIVVSLPVGFLAASNVSPSWVSNPTKAVLGFIRSIPVIIVAIICVNAVGLGPFPGVLAIAFHSVGMLGKFYAEEFETADSGIINAIKGTGASWPQTVRFGVWPQCIPQIVAFSVYRFEMNFRDATVLGIVGAGGIGFYILMYANSFQWQKVSVLLMVIIGVVLLLDQATLLVRK